MTTKSLLAALDPLGASVRIDFCRPPTLARMEEMLRDGQASGEPYHLVHFDGHGSFLPEAQIGALCLEKPDGGSGESRTDHVRADRLKTSESLIGTPPWLTRMKIIRSTRWSAPSTI